MSVLGRSEAARKAGLMTSYMTRHVHVVDGPMATVEQTESLVVTVTIATYAHLHALVIMSVRLQRIPPFPVAHLIQPWSRQH